MRLIGVDDYTKNSEDFQQVYGNVQCTCIRGLFRKFVDRPLEGDDIQGTIGRTRYARVVECLRILQVKKDM